MLKVRVKIATAEARNLYGTPIVIAETRSGERMQLQATFKDIAHAERVAAKVMERCSVDRSLWVSLAPKAGSAADVAARALAISERLYRERYEAERVAA
jgi:hypothetical protein